MPGQKEASGDLDQRPVGPDRPSEGLACRALGQLRATQRRVREPPDEEARQVVRMVELASKYGRYGYRGVSAMLRGEGWMVNHKRVERLGRQEGLKVPSRQPEGKRLWLTDDSCVRLRPIHRNHVWSYDFLHDQTEDCRAFRLLTVLDEYTRECLAMDVVQRMSYRDVMDRLEGSASPRDLLPRLRSINPTWTPWM